MLGSVENPVGRVLFRGAPREVAEAVVARVAIQVAALLASRTEADERPQYGQVNPYGYLAPTELAEHHGVVASAVPSESDEESAGSGVPDLALIADLITPLETNEWKPASYPNHGGVHCLPRFFVFR